MSESKTQDPKYIIIDGALANAVTREFIPDDEPVFIMRGQDARAAEGIRKYGELCANSGHQLAVVNRESDFIQFANDNPDRMKEPDTAGVNDWPDYDESGGDEAGDDADTEKL